jgi:hypothetical protein
MLVGDNERLKRTRFGAALLLPPNDYLEHRSEITVDCIAFSG